MPEAHPMQICRYRDVDGRPALGAISPAPAETAAGPGEIGLIHRLETDGGPFPDMDGWLARPDALDFMKEAVGRAMSFPPSRFLMPSAPWGAQEPRRLQVGISDEAERIVADPSPSPSGDESQVRRLWPENRDRSRAGGQPRHLEGSVPLAPVQSQEVWAAGVTYERSRTARMEESVSGGSFYDLVYGAERPELFFKATPGRVVAPGAPIRIRRDSSWNVPEPELALVISAAGRIVGYTIGNDVSSRSIEGENPLYLPQAKVYDGSCALGPVITLAGEGGIDDPHDLTIRLVIRRSDSIAFEGEISTSRMRRPPQELVDYLFRENTFVCGALLLTGTGIVPPDEFTLESGDRVGIEITGIGTLVNTVA